MVAMRLAGGGGKLRHMLLHNIPGLLGCMRHDSVGQSAGGMDLLILSRSSLLVCVCVLLRHNPCQHGEEKLDAKYTAPTCLFSFP